MLVLTRKLEESIIISDDIVITILSIDRDKVKLGIQAPRDIPVLRKELYQAVKEQNEVAARLADKKEEGKFGDLRAFLAGETPADESSKSEEPRQ